MPAEPVSPTSLSGNLYDPAVGNALRSLVDRYGVTLVKEPGRLRGLLQDDCPQAKREISVLMQALDENVPQDLMRVHSGEPISSLSPRLIKRLSEEKSMSAPASLWAVSTWAHGLGINTPVEDQAAFRKIEESQREAANDRSAPVEQVVPPIAPMQLPPAPKKARGRNGLWLAIIVLGIAAFAMFGLKQPALVVNSVDMEGPFAGDGKPHSVVLRYTAHNNVLRSVETRFVRGDGTWDTRPATYDISASDGAPGQAAVQTLSYTTSKPASVTFSYVLIGGDGKRSAPFEHTFNIVPPPQITDLTVPRSLHVGADFSVTLNYQRGASDIVKVERHVINSNVPWGQNDAEQTTQLKDTTGSFNYAFSAAQQPVRSTVEFVIEDAQGIRSEPKRVVLNIGATNVASPNAPSPSTPSPSAPSPSTPNVRDARGRPATVVAVREVRAPGQSTGMGGAIGAMLGAIAGSKLGHGRGRAPTAVIGAGGGALAGNAVESNARATVTWQTTVQFDDGSRRVFTQTDAPRWRAGDRVNAVNGVLSVP